MKRRYSYVWCLVAILCVNATGAIPEGIVSHWNFDGDLIDSVGAIDTTFAGGAPQFTTAPVEQGLVFDGQDDFVRLDLTQSPSVYTIALWVMVEDTDNMNIIVRTNSSGPTSQYSHHMRIQDGVFHHYLWVGQERHISGTTQVEPDTWYHVAIVARNDGPMWLYVNGEAEGESMDTAGTLWGGGDRYHLGSNSGAGMGYLQGTVDDLMIYERELSPEEIQTVMSRGLYIEGASAPFPAYAVSDVSRDIILSWNTGAFAATHNVYFGTGFDAVKTADATNPLDVLASLGQDANTFDPGRLAFDQTYYWRVDEVNSAPDFTVFPGSVWNFTTEPFAIEVTPVAATASSFDTNMEPEKTIDGSGLNADDEHDTGSTNMWLTSLTDTERWIQYEFAQPQKLHQMRVWNSNQSLEFLLGYGARDVTIETSMDGANWTVLADVPEFTRAPSTPGYTHNTEVLFGGITARYVKLTINTGWGTALPQVGLSEVRFLVVPVYARQPQPAHGATDQPINVPLSWRAGREAGVHNVYLGTDPQALALVADRTSATAITVAADLDQIHYWRVDEVNDVEDPALWEGILWDFTTAPYSVVDDMESYDNEDNKPWKTWDDGFDDNTNGSQVGENPVQQLFGPETTILHNDKQSLPIWYDNSTASLSEATRTFTPAQDFSRAGIQTLVLFFVKGVDNTGAGRLYVKINDAQVLFEEPTDPPPGWDFWTQWNIDLSTVNTDVTQVSTLTIGIEGAGAKGVLYVDDIRLYGVAPNPAHTVLSWFEAESGIITTPMEIFTDDSTASAGQHIGVLEGTGNSITTPTDGTATYSFDIPADGVYRLAFRVSIAGDSDDSFWVRIPGMVTNTTNHASGWIAFSNITQDTAWHWEEVHSSNDNNQVVEFTLSAGTHTLEIAHREDGALLDAIAIIAVNRIFSND